jgi:hypothetical protein
MKKIAKSHKTAQKYAGISPIMSTVNVSKPATILYKKLPDNMILITGFENFLTMRGIQEKYGWDVISVYGGYPDYMMLGTECIHIYKDHSASTVPLNKIYNKKDFSSLIAHVKKCGSLLHDIIAAVNDGQVKRITI